MKTFSGDFLFFVYNKGKFEKLIVASTFMFLFKVHVCQYEVL